MSQKKVPLNASIGRNLGRGNCLVGKVIGPKDRFVSHNEIANHFRDYWNVQHGFNHMDADRNMVFFKFNSPIDLGLVQQRSPWTIGKLLFVLTEVDENDVNDSVDFSWVPFWIQIRGLLYGLMNKETVESIGNTIGRFVESDCDQESLAIGASLARRAARTWTRYKTSQNVSMDSGSRGRGSGTRRKLQINEEVEYVEVETSGKRKNVLDLATESGK
ncbi:OLC1v1009109C1 [Oldenlandia corymbosa var. corymbosa]|uniref:OLC1v1009109C1 n=1 Tax=Oldenlandia corymbosa var. corymbosa TaxID=529605 RepID=A0AAV1DQI9_OLDCO|nr:OLC1v1009109C1 [Oldenlandia corymbosa var. corymbosa]